MLPPAKIGSGGEVRGVPRGAPPACAADGGAPAAATCWVGAIVGACDTGSGTNVGSCDTGSGTNVGICSTS